MKIIYETTSGSGKLNAQSIEPLEEFFGQSKLIRTQLGKQSYLLDNYLSLLAEPMNRKLPQDAAADGFEAMEQLFAVCVSVCRGDKKHSDHWFYGTATEYIKNHPLPLQEPHTLANIYCVLLSDEYEKAAIERYLNDTRDEQDDATDDCEINYLYNAIITLLGSGKPMDRLIWLFRQKFLIIDTRAAFIQGMNSQLLYCLTYRDRETSKQVFQLLPD
jgi:hypothetical protein